MHDNETPEAGGASAVDPILRPRLVAALYGVCTKTLRNWEKQGVGPTRIRLTPRNAGYRLSEVNRFLEERQQSSRGARD